MGITSGCLFYLLLKYWYFECTYSNGLDDAILISTHNIYFHDIISKHLFSSAFGRISKGLKNEFKSVTVNEPSVFESSKFYCSLVPHS